jgi:hypothetical protein
MATKQRADKQKEKEKREKIILAALVGVLVIVGALELPKMLKSGGSNSSAATTAQTNSTSPVVLPSGTAASGPTAVSALPDPSPYQPSAGQLSQFSLFNGGDPFGSAVTTSSAATTPAITGETTKSTTTTNSHNSFVAAKISVSGTSQTVLLRGTFPSTSPAFVLDSITAKQIKIGVNGGSFASGQEKVTIKKGGSVVLVNTVDSMRYVIKYVAPLTSQQAQPRISTSTTSGTTGATTASSTASTGTTS